MKKPNGILMADCIKEEWLTAIEEQRNPTSSNAIAIFREKMNPPLPEVQIYLLFDFVFHEIQKITGAKVSKIGPDSNN